VENTYELLPLPLKVKIIRLYILLSKIDIVMNKKLLEKLEDIIVLLMKLKADGILGNLLVSTFGRWYFYPPLSTLQLLYLFGLSFALVLFISYLLPIPDVGGGIERTIQISDVFKQSPYAWTSRGGWRKPING
jgi:hypothetical protein